MKIHSIIILFLLYSQLGFAQNPSEVYNANGRLITDTSYAISKTQLNVFKTFEDTLLKFMCTKIVYPEVEYEAQIGDSLLVISFLIHGNDSIDNVTVETQPQKGIIYITKEIKEVIARYSPNVGQETIKTLEGRKFYLAFKFNPKASRDGNIVKNGLIRIERKPLPMQSGSWHSTVEEHVDY